MKKNYFIIIISLCLLLVANNCRNDCHKAIRFINNSSKDVFIENIGASPYYLDYDTLDFYKILNNPIDKSYTNEVKPGEKKGFFYRCFDDGIENGRVSIFVFDAEILRTVPWDTIGKYYMVLKTYRPTMEEMENSNWTITYTGE